MERFRRLYSSLSYANVMATLAAFVALGGSSYAAVNITGRDVRNNSLTGADIRNNSLSGSDIRDNSLSGRDIRNNSLSGADVRNNSLTSTDVRNGSLLAKDFKKGQLPTADPAGATSWTVHREVALGATQQLPAIPGFAQLQIICVPPRMGGGAFLSIVNVSGGAIDSVASYQTTGGPGNFAPQQIPLVAGEQFQWDFPTGVTRFILQLAPNTPDLGPVATVTASYVVRSGQPCDVMASASWQDPVAG